MLFRVRSFGLRNTVRKFAELKRMERDHAKEKQKLVKDKDAGAYIQCLGLKNHNRDSSHGVQLVVRQPRAS